MVIWLILSLVLVSLWDHGVNLVGFGKPGSVSSNTFFENWMKKIEVLLKKYNFIIFLSWFSHKFSILWLRSFVLPRKIACLFLSLVCLFVSFNSYACYPALLAKNLYWEGILLVHPPSLNQNLCHLCPPYLPISIIAIPSIFMLLSIFQIKLVMWKLVIKALTNLMAHFTFLHLINLNHCAHLCCVYACAL